MAKIFGLIKPIPEFKFETFQYHGTNCFRLATQDEIYKLDGTVKGSSRHVKLTHDIYLDEVLECITSH